ncbi:MAG: methylenetetrahydromethanopterin dehydrogenase, partial [Mesorhizobium sp.]
MARKHILHMLTPLKHMSPFDVNMALDAGFDAVVPYVDVSLGEVTGLVQDAIFSRPPDVGVDTGIFIAGKDASLALDMFEAARKAMVPPFQVSVFADPA